jgi:hypothetical protein
MQKQFTVNVDISEIRTICEKYGQDAAKALIEKIVTDLRWKITNSVDFKTCDIGKKVLVEG